VEAGETIPTTEAGEAWAAAGTMVGDPQFLTFFLFSSDINDISIYIAST
jgi:hypothetical protein